MGALPDRDQSWSKKVAYKERTRAWGTDSGIELARLGNRFWLFLMIKLIHRVSLAFPGLQAAHERANAGDPDLRQFHRYLGAGRFAGAGAVEDDFPIAWNLGVA